MKLARECTVIWVILDVSDVRSWRNFIVTYSRIHCKMYFYALWVPWQCSRTHAKIWRWSVGVFFGGGVVWGGGLAPGGGAVAWWGWPCVSCVVFDVLLCILTNCFFQSLFLLLFCLLSSPARWVLPASLLASLASCCFLSVWFALHRRAAVFGPVFSVRVPTSWECVLAKQEGSLKLCALLGFSILGFFCLLPLFLVWFAVHRTASVFTA